MIAPAGFAFQGNQPLQGFDVSGMIWPAFWLLAGLITVIAAAIVAKRLWEEHHYQEVFLRNRSTSGIVRALSGNDFEYWVRQLFLSIGAKARQIGGRGDHGIDVVVEYKGKKIGVQCKKYYGDRLVGEPMVRDLYGVKWAEGFDLVMLITTGNFSNEAIAWARGKRDVILVNQKLLERIMMDSRILKDML